MSEDYLTGARYCEVYDEPRHRFHLRNAYTNIYEIELPPGCDTWFHRHTEDTVYFVIADAEVQESFIDKPAVMTRAPAGGTLCRNHRDTHLIHQVSNRGTAPMHMVGAEALAPPPYRAGEPLALPGHTQAWATERFRVYDVATGNEPLEVRYPVYGLLVALAETCVAHPPAARAAGRAAASMRGGGFVWMEPPYTVRLPRAFRGIFAEWI